MDTGFTPIYSDASVRQGVSQGLVGSVEGVVYVLEYSTVIPAHYRLADPADEVKMVEVTPKVSMIDLTGPATIRILVEVYFQPILTENSVKKSEGGSLLAMLYQEGGEAPPSLQWSLARVCLPTRSTTGCRSPLLANLQVF